MVVTMAMKLHNAHDRNPDCTPDRTRNCTPGHNPDRNPGYAPTRDHRATATSLTRKAIPCPADYAQIGGGGAMLSRINASFKAPSAGAFPAMAALSASADSQPVRAGWGLGRGPVQPRTTQQNTGNDRESESVGAPTGARAALLRGRESVAREALANQRRDCCAGRRHSG